MIKSLIALTVFALLGVFVMVLPGFAPRAKAAEAVALPKADRLLVVQNCSSQTWPLLKASCLHDVRSGTAVREARLVTQGE
jgi:hypothetical protein